MSTIVQSAKWPARKYLSAARPTSVSKPKVTMAILLFAVPTGARVDIDMVKWRLQMIVKRDSMIVQSLINLSRNNNRPARKLVQFFGTVLCDCTHYLVHSYTMTGLNRW